ncbi:MAG: hypothetical protein K0S32_1785 [Bacteroidetes bacterium]|jgi:predicted 2-oxoglutarate/Fe(II)-dependent dioxygenase YbiX|nr:hypothetical protein [Bacteroidota bacterium]
MHYHIVDNFLSAEKCKELIELSEKMGYEEADISYTSGAQMNKQYRDNQRCLYTDENLRKELEKLIMPYVPLSLQIKKGGDEQSALFLKLSGKFRFYKYLSGQKFKKHRDGTLEEEGGVSRITVLIYLNTAEKGGETVLCDRSLEGDVVVPAETGKMLWFDHKLLHSGEELLSGVKYILRTDFIYNL